MHKTVNANLLEAFDGNGNFRGCFVKRNKKTDTLLNEVFGAPHERMSSCLIITEGANGYKDIVFPLRNCIINLLNGIIDVDNIDYSIRDATASGYKSAQVDYERLLKSNTIALAYEHDVLTLKGERFDYSVCLKHFISDQVTEDSPLFMTISGSATLVLIWSETEKTNKDHIGLEITGDIWEDDEHNSDKRVRVIYIREESSINLKLWDGKLEIRPRSQNLEGCML